MNYDGRVSLSAFLQWEINVQRSTSNKPERKKKCWEKFIGFMINECGGRFESHVMRSTSNMSASIMFRVKFSLQYEHYLKWKAIEYFSRISYSPPTSPSSSSSSSWANVLSNFCVVINDETEWCTAVQLKYFNSKYQVITWPALAPLAFG